MKLLDQHAAMEKFYHGHTPTHPPQIKLLAEVHMNYLSLYDEIDVTIKGKKQAKKAAKTSVTRFKLKPIICKDESTSYYRGIDITFEDLKKKSGWKNINYWMQFTPDG